MFEPAARNTDPITSHLAAAQAKELAKRHHSLIVECLMKNGPCGVDKIAQYICLQPHQVGKRMKELQKDGLVILTGKMVYSSSGRLEREWSSAIAY